MRCDLLCVSTSEKIGETAQISSLQGLRQSRAGIKFVAEIHVLIALFIVNRLRLAWHVNMFPLQKIIFMIVATTSQLKTNKFRINFGVNNY